MFWGSDGVCEACFFTLVLFTVSYAGDASGIKRSRRSSRRVRCMVGSDLSASFCASVGDCIPTRKFVPATSVTMGVTRYMLLRVCKGRDVRGRGPFSIGLMGKV